MKQGLSVSCQWVSIVVSSLCLLLLVTLVAYSPISIITVHAETPANPHANIAWSSGEQSVADVASAFNYARSVENKQLGTNIPLLVLPNQTAWDALSDGDKAMYLINDERNARGIAPLTGREENVQQVAQTYANYLLQHNAMGHQADGRTPWERLDMQPAIAQCHDFLNVAENLAYFWSTTTIPLPIERAVYNWLYDDADSDWGHRNAILWYPYKDNSGTSGNEGFVGIGRASGAHNGWEHGEIVVMNVFDPCDQWVSTHIVNTPTNTPSVAVVDVPTPTVAKPPTKPTTIIDATSTPTPTPIDTTDTTPTSSLKTPAAGTPTPTPTPIDTTDTTPTSSLKTPAAGTPTPTPTASARETPMPTSTPIATTVTPTSANDNEQCFDKVVFCIDGRIGEYWRQYGGLPVFGYPITQQKPELVEGTAFETQWFERNRLEIHPELSPPFDVLLGRLGAEVLEQDGRDWFDFPRSEPRDGCLYFEETGHNICGDILAAWRADGLEFDGFSGKSQKENIALFGLPLSDEQTETIEGNTYTVQWFERARFELHPENNPPYHVLLGLLGNELRGCTTCR